MSNRGGRAPERGRDAFEDERCEDERCEHERFSTQEKLAALPYVLSPALGVAYGVSKLPFAALVDAEGVLRARGLVNTREHLESLVESMDSGVASLQDYFEQHQSEVDESMKEKAS